MQKNDKENEYRIILTFFQATQKQYISSPNVNNSTISFAFSELFCNFAAESIGCTTHDKHEQTDAYQ